MGRRPRAPARQVDGSAARTAPAKPTARSASERAHGIASTPPAGVNINRLMPRHRACNPEHQQGVGQPTNPHERTSTERPAYAVLHQCTAPRIRALAAYATRPFRHRTAKTSGAVMPPPKTNARRCIPRPAGPRGKTPAQPVAGPRPVAQAECRRLPKAISCASS